MEVGRLASASARWLAPLLLHGAIVAKAVCSICPSQQPMRISDRVLLTVSLFGSFAAFNTSPEVGLALQQSVGDADQEHVALLSEAWRKCFLCLGLIQSCAGIATASSTPNPTDDTERGTAAAAAVPPSAEDADEGGGDDDDSDLQRAVEQMGAEQADLAEAEPHPNVVSTLRPYQKQALAWFLDRESLQHPSAAGAPGRMHPLWQELPFAHGAGIFYWKEQGGQVSIHFPSANAQARGGILADAMVGEAVFATGAAAGRGGGSKRGVRGHDGGKGGECAGSISSAVHVRMAGVGQDGASAGTHRHAARPSSVPAS
jgi:DNA repair protein RAD5